MAEQLALGLSLAGDGAAPARLRSRSQPLFAQGFARRIELRRAGGEWIAVGDEVAGLQAPSLYTSHGAGDVRVYADRAVLARAQRRTWLAGGVVVGIALVLARSEEHTSELQSLMRISYAVFCLKKKKTHKQNTP